MHDEVTDVVIDVSNPETVLEAARGLCLDGDYAEAVELVQTALARFADADPITLGSFNSVLASAHQCLGDLNACALAADTALAALSQAPDEDAVELGVVCHTRAVVHLHRGNIDEATPLLDRAAQGLEQAGPEARVDFCSVLLTMAEVASATGASGEAIALCERVIQEVTRIEVGSEEHATQLNRVNARAFLGLGSAFAQQGATDHANDFLARAVEFLDAGFGHGHPEMTAGLTEVASIFRAVGNESAALVIDEELAVVAP